MHMHSKIIRRYQASYGIAGYLVQTMKLNYNRVKCVEQHTSNNVRKAHERKQTYSTNSIIVQG